MKKNILIVLLFSLFSCQKAKEELPCSCETPIELQLVKTWTWEQSKINLNGVLKTPNNTGDTRKIVFSSIRLFLEEYKNDSLMVASNTTTISIDKINKIFTLKKLSTGKKQQFTLLEDGQKLRVSEEVNENDNFTNSEEHIYKSLR
jgi:hypothetical protein